jgi:serine/threonine protein kinase
VIVTGSKIFGPKKSEYEVLEFVGSGSFGTVYKVKELSTGKIQAVKTLSAPSAQDLQFFINEGKLAVGIRHPNVIEYYFFHDGSQFEDLPPYILMEYAEGGTLENLLRAAQGSGTPFEKKQLLEMFRQLIAGMAAINEKLVHRDMKPGNVVLSAGVLKITDFGLAKLVAEATRSLTFKGWGSFPYMAPEAWRFEKNTLQLDVYSVGMIFYELSTLRAAFNINSADPQKWMAAHLYETVVSPDKLNPTLGPKLAQIIMKMIEKDPAKRFSNWVQISGLLEKQEPQSEEDKRLISAMLEKRLQTDSAAQAAAAESQRKQDERSNFCKLVLFQARQTIIDPLRELVNHFNEHYAGAQARVSDALHENEIRFGINLPSGQQVTFTFRVVLPENFIMDMQYEDYGRTITRREVHLPKYRDRIIQGWGCSMGQTVVESICC